MHKQSAIPLSPYTHPKNYSIALRVSRQSLASNDPQEMAPKSGCLFDEYTSAFNVTCLDHPFTVSYPEGIVKFRNTDLEPTFALQIIMINYLSRADNTPLTYQYVPYRDMAGGNTYYGAFEKTAIRPIAQAFGHHPEKLIDAAAPFGGIPYTSRSGIAVMLYLLPRVPLLYKVWPGDDEFPAQANILLDSSTNHYLHTEDVAACDIVTRLLIKQI